MSVHSDELTPGEESVRSIYRTAYHKFIQTKAGSKPVSPRYVEDKTASLDKKTGPERTSFWTKLDHYCLSRSLEPTRLAQAFFMQKQAMVNYALIRHEDIFKDGVLSTYNQLKPSLEMFKEQLRMQHQQLEVISRSQALVHGIPPAESMPAAVQMMTNQFCPLFRYCVLRGANDEAAKKWFFAAFAQYKPDREIYDQGWGAFIPADLKQAVTEGAR
jgi:hypothetical protein